MEKSTDLTITLEEPFSKLKERYPFIEIQKQPGDQGGVNFYKSFWSETALATFTIQYKDNPKTKISHAISLLTAEFVYKSSEGISKVRINSGITSDDTISHDEARIQLHNILQEYLSIGWKREINFSEPRLSDSQAMHYQREKNSVYSLDPTYLPTIKEWMAIDDLGTFWLLQLNNQLFMTIDLKRKNSKTDASFGVYLLSITIVNDQEQGRSHFPAGEKFKWSDQKNWDEMKTNLLKTRKQTEADLALKGYIIDEEHIDIDIKPRT